jgi:hypothetical protein
VVRGGLPAALLAEAHLSAGDDDDGRLGVRLAHLVPPVVVPALGQVRLAAVHRARRALVVPPARPRAYPGRRRRGRSLPGRRGLPASAVLGAVAELAPAHQAAELEVDRALGPLAAAIPARHAAAARGDRARVALVHARRRRPRRRGVLQLGEVPRRGGSLGIPVHGDRARRSARRSRSVGWRKLPRRPKAGILPLVTHAHSQAGLAATSGLIPSPCPCPSLSFRGRFLTASRATNSTGSTPANRGCTKGGRIGAGAAVRNCYGEGRERGVAYKE